MTFALGGSRLLLSARVAGNQNSIGVDTMFYLIQKDAVSGTWNKVKDNGEVKYFEHEDFAWAYAIGRFKFVDDMRAVFVEK